MEIKKETKPAPLLAMGIFEQILIFFSNSLQRDNFGDFGSIHSLKKQLLSTSFALAGCPFWCCGWTTNKTNRAPVLVEFLLQEGLWERGRQTEISTTVPPGEG